MVLLRRCLGTSQRVHLATSICPQAGRYCLNRPVLRSTLTYPEATIVMVICFGLFIVWSSQAVLAGLPKAVFSDDTSLGMIVIELVLGTLALVYLKGRQYDIASLYPKPELRGALVGTGLYGAALFLELLAIAPFQKNGGLVDFSFSGVSVPSTVLMAMVNGTFEEMFLLGVLLRSFKPQGVAFAMGLSLVVRLLYHTYQGPVGVLCICVIGLVFSAFYVRTGRLWPVVFAHMLGDIVPVLLGEH